MRAAIQQRVLDQQASAIALLVFGGATGAWLASNEDQHEATISVFERLPYIPVAAIVALLTFACLHYFFAAFALRALAESGLGMRDTTYAQLAAAASNRVIPNGIGGAAINLRYLLCCGSSPLSAATALGALAIVGIATDALFFAFVTLGAPVIGLPGATGELRSLAARGIKASHSNSGLWIVAAAIALVAAGYFGRHWISRRSSRPARKAGHQLQRFTQAPGRSATAGAASLATTLVLSVGFALTVHVWGSNSAPPSIAAVLAIYLVSVTAGGAVPLPAFMCVTEAAMVSALVLAGYRSPSAVLCVVVFRVLTYWLALPVGVWAALRLRHRRLL